MIAHYFFNLTAPFKTKGDRFFLAVKRFGFVVLFFISVMGWSQNAALFEQGKEQYKAQNYQEAISTWKKIIDNGQHSAEVYFNLGNAYYKLNKIGPAIYFYEKALQLNPADKDIKTNLQFAQNARVDVIEPLPKTLFQKWYNTLSSILTFDGWAVASVVFSFAFSLLFLLYYFSFSEGKKRLFFLSSMLFLFLFTGSFLLAFLTYSDSQNNHPAIVFTESTQVKTEPNMGSETAFTLHEGTKIQLLEEEDNWARIQIENGKEGWIPLEDVKGL